MASIDDHKKVVKLLLEKGADPSMKNAENLTSSQLAYKPHKDVRIIIKHLISIKDFLNFHI